MSAVQDRKFNKIANNKHKINMKREEKMYNKVIQKSKNKYQLLFEDDIMLYIALVATPVPEELLFLKQIE